MLAQALCLKFKYNIDMLLLKIYGTNYIIRILKKMISSSFTQDDKHVIIGGKNVKKDIWKAIC
jgi:hypothetical protein